MTFSSRFSSATTLSSSSKRASRSWRKLSIHAASSSSRRRPSLQVCTRPTFSVVTSPLLQDGDMLLHAREGHVKLLAKVRDRSICPPELLQSSASGGVRKRGERGFEAFPPRRWPGARHLFGGDDHRLSLSKRHQYCGIPGSSPNFQPDRSSSAATLSEKPMANPQLNHAAVKSLLQRRLGPLEAAAARSLALPAVHVTSSWRS
jgi:hypothetical protein